MSGEVEVRWYSSVMLFAHNHFWPVRRWKQRISTHLLLIVLWEKKRHYQVRPVSVKKYALVGIFFLALLSSVK